MKKKIKIGNRYVGEGERTFLVAEVSANHLQDYGRAEAIIRAAKEAGADAVKLQTYTPDTITLDCDNDYFQITQGTIWDGTTLHKLYEEAYTPWEWQPKLMELANGLGMECFSSPFDATAVDFMREMDMPAYKVASFEINDIPLIRRIARIGKPIIFATGIAYLEDIERALAVCKEEGNEQVILLKCTSTYPSPYEDMNLKVIPHMAETFDCLAGLSDHSMGTAVAVASVALGAKMVEKHLTLSRPDGGPDAAFSMEPEEFRKMAEEIRIVEKALGRVTYELTEKQKKSREDGRSLFVVEDIGKGEIFTEENVRSIRPAFGMHTMYYDEVIGKKARVDIAKGTPLDWKYIL
ncbi:MAG: pseudaminic acid synthase [Kineothrix sp.]|nr:pseudaminic acid synthase [Lachnospiraceae bacterium 28-4]MCX4342347.1 pseudaminic acid synthase [Kineothrix sp.]